MESSKFITKKKSKTLIEKIHTMTRPGQVAKLKRNNYVVNRIKQDNEQIYYICLLYTSADRLKKVVDEYNNRRRDEAYANEVLDLSLIHI